MQDHMVPVSTRFIGHFCLPSLQLIFDPFQSKQLKEAWVSGARDWTTAQRRAFANDLVRPQLIGVTVSIFCHDKVVNTECTSQTRLQDTVNQAKGDKDPAKWLPPLASYRELFYSLIFSLLARYSSKYSLYQ